MGRRLLTSNKCPLCGGEVEQVPFKLIEANPKHYNAELVITKRGIKQYIHSACWDGMIAEKLPYNGKLYL